MPMSLNHAMQEQHQEDMAYRRLMEKHRELDQKIEHMKHVPIANSEEMKHLKIMKLRLADQMEMRLKELEH